MTETKKASDAADLVVTKTSDSTYKKIGSVDLPDGTFKTITSNVVEDSQPISRTS